MTYAAEQNLEATENEDLEQDMQDEEIEVSPLTADFCEHLDSILEDDNLRDSQLGSKVSELFSDPEFKQQMQAFAEEAEESDGTYFLDQLTCITWEVEEIPFGDILEGSQYQHQFGILSSAMNSLFLDKTTGLAMNSFLFMMPIAEVVRRSDDTLIQVGGHHRGAGFALMMRQGGAEWGTILDMNVPVLVGTINEKKLAELNDVPLSKVEEYVKELEAKLWMASNKSRKPTTVENSSYADAKKGIDPTSLDSILGSNILSTKEKFVKSIMAIAYGEGILPDQKTGATERQLVAFPQATGDDRLWPDPKPNTFSKIAAAFYVGLSKIVFEAEGKEGKAKKIKKWEPTLKVRKHLVPIVEWVFTPDQRSGLCPLEEAIPIGLSRSKAEFSGNIARNDSNIGHALAELLDKRVEPAVPANVPKAKAKADKGTKNKKFKPRNVRA